MNISAVIVLFNPEFDVIDNIKSYSKYVSNVIVIDNSEIINESIYSLLKQIPSITIIQNHQNNGIASALNEGINLAINKGSNWFLTMDQDSFFEDSVIKQYLSEFSKLVNTENSGMFGPSFENNVQQKNGGVENVIRLITSGSLISKNAYQQVGGFDEKLFIDEVDFDFCYRAKLKGFCIFQFQSIFLNHNLGTKKAVGNVFGQKKSKTFHSPIRLYYIVRNSCFTSCKYKSDFPEAIKQTRRDVIIRIKNNVFYGDNKLSCIKYIIMGYIHYKLKRFGKY